MHYDSPGFEVEAPLHFSHSVALPAVLYVPAGHFVHWKVTDLPVDTFALKLPAPQSSVQAELSSFAA